MAIAERVVSKVSAPEDMPSWARPPILRYLLRERRLKPWKSPGEHCRKIEKRGHCPPANSRLRRGRAAAEVGATPAVFAFYLGGRASVHGGSPGPGDAPPGTRLFLINEVMERFALTPDDRDGASGGMATDSNSGSCPMEVTPIVMSLACLQMKLTPAEAIFASTINVAHAPRDGR